MKGGEVIYRDWRPDDPVGDITAMLHAAYRAHALMGFNFTAADQDDATTLQRLSSGRSMVAEMNGRIVGTITLHGPQAADMCLWYREHYSFEQFGVHPSHQKLGIGRELLRRTEERAREAGARELAFDTSEGATDLCRWYAKMDYRFIKHLSKNGKTYRSVILSKALID